MTVNDDQISQVIVNNSQCMMMHKVMLNKGKLWLIARNITSVGYQFRNISVAVREFQSRKL